MFHENYPKVYEALSLLGHNNNMSLKNSSKWPKYITYGKLEIRLKRLNQKELETFVIGETTEMEKLKIKYKLHLVDEFLTDVFDGPLSDLFFES